MIDAFEKMKLDTMPCSELQEKIKPFVTMQFGMEEAIQREWSGSTAASTTDLLMQKMTTSRLFNPFVHQKNVFTNLHFMRVKHSNLSTRMMWKIGRNGCSERGWQVFGSADELARCASSSASIGASIEAAIASVVRSK